MKNKKEIRFIKRKNAKLYPIYKMFSWDLLFFYSIEFLFYTITKSLTPSQVLIASGLYLLFKIIMQIPAVIINDFLGKRKSIILGNSILVLYMLTLIYLPGMISIILANLLCALGYDIKLIAESNLLYDSVSTKGGEGLYSKIDAKGGSWYYLLDAISALLSGYLFVRNNYFPLYVCLSFLIISTILSFGFKDVYKIKLNPQEKVRRHTFKEYKKDLQNSFKFIFNSNRMKALILFQVVFYSLIKITDTYRSNLLVDIGISEEHFSMIFAVLNLMGSLALYLKGPIEKKFKNKTIAFISLTYIISSVIIGTISSIWIGKTIIPFILVLYIIQRMDTSIWYILEYKYLKNFTTASSRSKITFTYEFIGCLSASIFSILGGLLLEVSCVQNAFLIVGLIGLMFIVLTLDFMRKRIGLKPQEYKKKDLEFDVYKK